MLSAKEIATVNDFLLDRGISYEPLRVDLIDHLCCSIELEMDNGTAFKTALHSAAQQFGDLGLETTQEATLYFLTQNLKKMKVATSITGCVGSILVLIGILFKIMHWPGAGVCFVLGSVIMGVFYLPLLLTVKMKEVQTTAHKLGVLTGILAAIMFLFGITFKVMHWPGANILINLSIAICCLVFLPLHFVRAYQQPDNKWFNSTIIISIFTGVLALYVMTNRSDSMDMLAANETRLTAIQHTNQNLKTASLTVDQSTLLQVINQYEAQLLSSSTIANQDVYTIDFETVDWNKNIGYLMDVSQTEFDKLVSVSSSTPLETHVAHQFAEENLKAIHLLPLFDRIVALEYLKAQLL